MSSIASKNPVKWFFVALVLTTIVFVPLDSVGFVLPKIFFLAIAGFLGALAALRDPERDALSVLLTLGTGRLFLLLIIVTLLSPIWSIAPILSIVGSPPRFQGSLTQIAYFAVALGGIVAVQRNASRGALVRAIVTANALVVLYGILQAVKLDPLGPAWRADLFLGRIFSTIGQPTMLANFLLLTLPFVAWSMRDSNVRSRFLYCALTFLNLVVLLATASRAATVGIFVAAMLWAFTMPRRTPSVDRPRILLFAFAGLALAGIAAWSFAVRFSVPTAQPFALGARGVIWESALSMARQRPKGYGLETVGLVSPRFLSPVFYEYESLTTKIDDAHSEPLQIFLTIGWAGFLLMYGFLGLLFIGLWKNRTAHPLLPVIFIALAGTHVSLLAGVIDPATGTFAWLIAGMGLGSLPSPALERFPIFSKRVLGVAAVGSFLAIIIFGWWIIARFNRERYENLLRNGTVLAAADAAMRTEVIFPYDRQILIETAETALLALEQTPDAAATGRLHRIVSESAEQLSALTNMQDGMAPLLLGWQAAINGNGERAAELFGIAREMRPVDVAAYRIIAHGYSILGNKERERETLRALTGLLPRDWNDPSSPRGRILKKEQPWIEPLVESLTAP
ncbi:hypothetical protein A3A67_02935 [Candidatus Peribacteria bacterium RIFCSPLOWO2_01_FULL_51_18]|nr:MAG: hypothetical protein A3C52_00795 [Candidatus Peribacteria bacterium RIFCSPHIGHO2_02_FULL_51_15]OGJ66002.1 MAG: hypothetical protein A3A67_02935 [Candidatus Peribacteria bacterium RIFCSPLOWO2_01_FULL_51_18]